MTGALREQTNVMKLLTLTAEKQTAPFGRVPSSG